MAGTLMWLAALAFALAVTVGGLRRRTRNRSILFPRPRRRSTTSSSPTMEQWSRALEALAPDPARRARVPDENAGPESGS